MRLFQEVLTDSHSGRIILKMLVCGGCSALTQESRCKKNWGACVTVARSLWDRQVFIQRIDVGLKCLGLLRFKRSSTEGRTHGLPRTLLVTTCCYTNLPFNPTPLQFFFDKLGSPWHLAPVYYISADLIGWGSSWRSRLYFKIYVSWQYKAHLVTDINIQQPLLSDTCSQTNRILSTEHHSRWTRFTSVITLHDIESGAGQWPSWCRLLWNIRARKVREKSILLGYLMIDQWPMAINFNQSNGGRLMRNSPFSSFWWRSLQQALLRCIAI